MVATPQLIEAVWQKASTVGIPADKTHIWRKDCCSAWINRNQYGNRQSVHGWEIDHVNPKGGDALSNLQPLQWENNAAKGDGPLVCVVRSAGTANVRVR
jgi:hypothetical protein